MSIRRQRKVEKQGKKQEQDKERRRKIVNLAYLAEHSDFNIFIDRTL